MKIELPQRVSNPKNAEFLERGEYRQLVESVRRKLADSKIGAALYYAFDWATRIGPFVGPDLRIPNCGIRTVGAALHESGFDTRIIMGNWNPKFNPQHAVINGNVPEIFGVSSMQIHERDAHHKIRLAGEMGKDRPLILGGGPHANYQGWDFFNLDEGKSADVVVKGELNVTVSLMDRILDHKGRNETMCQGFIRARDEGALDDIGGLLYIGKDRDVIFDTGKPRLIGDLDEYPREIIGLSLLEGRDYERTNLSSHPLELDELKKDRGDLISTNVTMGCNLRCDFCPIPNMHQYTQRGKSGERMVEDIREIIEATGINTIFGTDDNHLMSKPGDGYVQNFWETMARGEANGKSFRDVLFFSTEATLGQTMIYRDKLPLMRDGGLRAIWFGIEDLDGELVKKGQNRNKTAEVFNTLRKNGIAPMPMMMHFEGQTRENILGQIKFLRDHGASTVQITYNTPSPGSADYDPQHFAQGRVLSRAGDVVIGGRHSDGNHVVSSTPGGDRVGRQSNLMACYESFYSPVNLARATINYGAKRLFGTQTERELAGVDLAMQIHGRRGIKISRENGREWAEALATRNYEYATSAPQSPIPIVGVGNACKASI